MQVLKEKQPFQERHAVSTLEIMDVETGTRRTVKKFDHLIEAPNWLGDGKTLLYNAGGHIFRFHLETLESEQLPIGFADHCNNDHLPSPTGEFLAISHGTAEDGQSRVYTAPLSGGVPRLITPIAPSYLHGVSPDGKTLAYCAERNGEFDIYTIPAEGGEETRLTFEPGLSDGPEYSPDGKHIWFNSVRSGLMQVWRMNADGSEQTRMTWEEERNCWFPHVSPDGTKVVYIAYRKGDVQPGDHPPHKNVELRLMSAEGGPSETICELFGGQGTLNVNSWSPDGREFAFVSYELK